MILVMITKNKHICGVTFDRMKSKDIHGEYYGQYSRSVRRAITPKGFSRAFYLANK